MCLVVDLVGKPFQEGGRGPDGYDCWGLAVEVFRRYGISIPNYRLTCATVTSGVIEKSKEWVRCTGEVPAPALIVFTTAGIADHVGVYLGAGRFIHSHRSAGVVITGEDHIFWKRRIEGYYAPGWLTEQKKQGSHSRNPASRQVAGLKVSHNDGGIERFECYPLRLCKSACVPDRSGDSRNLTIHAVAARVYPDL